MAFEIVVIGTSLGGLSALQEILGALTSEFPLAIAIVQHRHKESIHILNQFLQHYVALPLHDVEDKTVMYAGHIYLAPSDYHLLVEPGYFSLSTDEPVSFARPSIDVLFESAADAYGDRTIGVILTGANHDGAQGLARIKAMGGYAIVQDPISAENCVMPKAAIAATTVDQILPLPAIAPHLMRLCSTARR